MRLFLGKIMANWASDELLQLGRAAILFFLIRTQIAFSAFSSLASGGVLDWAYGFAEGLSEHRVIHLF